MEKNIYNINTKRWYGFWLEDLCKIQSGTRLTKKDQVRGCIPFIGATDSNNGITEFISNINNSLDKNVLGVNYNGSVVYNFYHPYSCVFSDDVKRLHFKEKSIGNEYTYLFLKQTILQQRKKYAYGYKFNGDRMKRQKILLPISDKKTPDYEFIQKYILIQEIKAMYTIVKSLDKNL